MQRTKDYPVVLTVLAGVPLLVAGLVTFAVIADGDGKFNGTEAAVFGTLIAALVAVGVADLVRWERWKDANR